MTDFSIVVPVSNGASLTRQCVQSLIGLRRRGYDLEIIVVDDASTDLTPTFLADFGSEIRSLRHQPRAGYVAACNAGAGLATAPSVIFLRNDALPHGGWLDALARYAERHPHVAVIGSKLLAPDGTIQHAGIAFGQDGQPRHLYVGFPEEHPAAVAPRAFQAVAIDGALVRREAFERVGGLDPDFGSGYEAVDLCLRLGEREYGVHYCPESVLPHLQWGPSGRTFAGQSDELYRRRWAGRVRPDEFAYYAVDSVAAPSPGPPPTSPDADGAPATVSDLAADVLMQLAVDPSARSRLVAETLAAVHTLPGSPGGGGSNGAGRDALLPTTAADAGDLGIQLERIVAAYRDRFGLDPALLEWESGLDLAALAPRLGIFSPPTDARALPYVDRSIDIVVTAHDALDALAEARRVASGALVRLVRPGSSLPKEVRAVIGLIAPPTLRVEWLMAEGAARMPTVSIVIPVYNKSEYTMACLAALEATLPEGFDGEIIVVDDASSDDTPALLERWAGQDPRRKAIRNPRNSGFIDTCNRGAAAASGDLVVFLNNDTIPLPGWLSALVRTFREYPDAGAVGGKLLYPDGTLQEAGGVIFSDASGCNYGKHDREPDAPRYSYVREVDYCSGAMLATPRALFTELGGFDTRYRPAFYEDSDYCFAVRERGYKVLYQCDSRIIHVEGASAGTDVSAGMKQYQVVNRHTFAEKWRDQLDRQPAPPDRYDVATWQALAARPGVKRALVAAARIPEFDREGGSRRIYHAIEFLRQEGWAVTFMAYGGFPADEKYLRALRQLGVATYPEGSQSLLGDDYLTEADRLIATGRFDLALLAFWWIGEFYGPIIRRLSPSTRIALDSIDLQFLRRARGIFRSTVSGESSDRGPDTLDAQYAEETRREINAYATMDAVLTVSQKEADIVNDFVGTSRLAHAVPDNEDMDLSPIPYEERRGMVFVGSFRHPPNIEAAQYLCREILPRLDRDLLEEHPLYLVGTGLGEEIRAAARGLDGVRLVGWVPSVVPYLERARISVAPLLHGAGTKRKLIQALMVGTPSVATPIGTEGLHLEDGRHVLVADDPDRFAEAITRLLRDRALWSELARAGRAHIAAAHGRARIRARMAEVASSILATDRGVTARDDDRPSADDLAGALTVGRS